MCNASSRITSNVVGWNMAFCGYLARVVMLIQRFGSALNLNIHFHMVSTKLTPSEKVEKYRINTAG